MIAHDQIDNGKFWSRPHKTWCFPTCCCACNCLFTPCRKLVSRSKRRIQKDDFDLDLSLVTPRIIVHGFPAIGIEHMYRNPRGEILRYLDTYHKDHWKLYNFCCEPGRGYEPELFHNRVERYPFKDHNTPPLLTMAAFANSVMTWLNADPENVVSMHCKAGKGRAGLMCCVSMVRTGFCQSAVEAMAHYDKTRVTNNKGLTVTSQRKYVVFYELLWRRYWGAPPGTDIGKMPHEDPNADPPVVYPVPEQPRLHLCKIEVLGVKEGVLKNISLTVFQGTNGLPLKLTSAKATTVDQIEFAVDCYIQGNFKVKVDHKPSFFKGAAKVVELWHNTLFIDPDAASMEFPLDQLDIKRKQIPKYGKDIKLKLSFTKDDEKLSSSIVVRAAEYSSQHETARAMATATSADTDAAAADAAKPAYSEVEMSDPVGSRV